MGNDKKKKKSHIPLRMNLMFFAVFLLFALLILRLGVVQIVHGEDAKRELERTDDVTVSTGVPRGLIYDRTYKQVVGNQSKRAITYTPAKHPKQEEMLETAQKLAQFIEMDTKKITLRDKQDYWLLTRPEEAKEKVSLEEANKKELSNADVDKLKRERITEEELNQITEDELQVLAIFREFASGYALVPQIVKNENVTKDEFAIVSEHLNDLPGVDTTMDWVRDYPYDKLLRPLLGNVTNGLPRENLEYYEARGYSRNDRVGKSYLELQYEDILSGNKEKVKNVTRSGNVLETDLIQEGKAGNTLVLSIDMELQAAIDKIIEDEIRIAKSKPGTQLLNKAFVTVMDPNTGEVLAMSGKQYQYSEEENKYVFNDFSTGNMTTAYAAGSVIKGATVLSGYMSGVLKLGETILDEPLYIKGSNKFSSVFNRSGNVYLRDHQAIVRSSNVYMAKIAIRMGDGQYRRNQSLIIDKEKAFERLRYNFNQFGLGVKTEIDLPGEQIGVRGNVAQADAANTFHFAIGQYDTYTPLQVAQYVSTIANGGYRMKPQVVKEIREPSNVNNELGKLVKSFEPEVLNRINATDDQIRTVQGGFRGVFTEAGGTGARIFKNKPYKAAGKTGTADTYEIDRNGNSVRVWNSSLIAYAPFDNPEIAFSVVIPAAYTYNASGHRMNQQIGEKVFDAYFDLKEKRAKEGSDSSGQEEKEE